MNTKEMYLICEEAVDNQISIKEEKPTGEIIIEVKLQDFFKRNRNGRIYGEALKAALAAKEVKELMYNKSWFGEAGHPNDKELSRQVTIDPTLISHEIRSIWIDGDTLFAYVHTIPGLYGEQFKAMIKRGTKVAFSLRAVGNVKKLPDGTMEVVAPMRVITYDWVILPSHECAYQQRIVSESALFNIENSYKNELVQEHAIFEKVNIAKVLTESKNVQELSKQLEFIYESITLSKDRKFAVLKEKDGSATLHVPLEEYVINKVNTHMASLIGMDHSNIIEENLSKVISKVKFDEDKKKVILDYITANSKPNYQYNEIDCTESLAARNHIYTTQDMEKYIKTNMKYLQKEMEWRLKDLTERASAVKFFKDKKCIWFADDGFGNAYYFSLSDKHLYYFYHDNMPGKDVLDDGTLETYLSNRLNDFYSAISDASALGESLVSMTIAGVSTATGYILSTLGLGKDREYNKLFKEYIEKNKDINYTTSGVDLNCDAYTLFTKNIFHKSHLIGFIAKNETFMRALTDKYYKYIKDKYKDPTYYAQFTGKNKEMIFLGKCEIDKGVDSAFMIDSKGEVYLYTVAPMDKGEYVDVFEKSSFERYIKRDEEKIKKYVKTRGV